MVPQEHEVDRLLQDRHVRCVAHRPIGAASFEKMKIVMLNCRAECDVAMWGFVVEK